MINFKRILTLFTCTVLNSLFSVGFAAELTEPIIQARTIAIAPYGIKSESGFSGIYYQLLKEVLERSSYQNQHIIAPYARIVHGLKSGAADITIMYKYQELVTHVDYIHPLPTLTNVIIGKSSLKLTKLSDLSGKIVAYLRGAKFSKAIDQDNNIIKHQVTDFYQALRMLESNRVDAVIGPLAPIQKAVNKLQLTEDFLGEPLIISQRTPWLQVSKKSRHKFDIKLLKQHFQQLINSGYYQQVKAQY